MPNTAKKCELILKNDKTTKGTTRFVNKDSEVCTAIYIRKPHFMGAGAIKVTIEEVELEAK